MENYFWQKESKMASTGKKKKKKKTQLRLISPNFNYGLQQQKKGSDQKNTVFTREKINFHQPE